MALLRYLIKPLGSFGTPLRSDTLHGHLLCAAAERDGEEAVAKLIDLFETGKPPFVCSSALPHDKLPMPCLPPLSRRVFESKYSGAGTSLFELLSAYKKFRKVEFIPLDVWQRLKDCLSISTLFEVWKAGNDSFETTGAGKAREWRKTSLEAHNTLDRQTGSVLNEGGLYFSESIFYADGITFDLYVRTDDPDMFETLLGHVAACGFGRDKSTGKGWFGFNRDADFSATKAGLDGDSPHRLNLSVLSGPDLSVVRGWYKTLAKNGKLWDGLDSGQPFKRTFLALAEGAVLTSWPETGFVLRNLHTNSKVVQITWPLLVPMTFQEG